MPHQIDIPLRKAALADAPAPGALHVAAWRETYTGLVPDALLASLSADARSAMWRGILDDPVATSETTVFVADDGGTIVAFGACGTQRDETLKRRGFAAEIGALYVLRAHQRRGLGRTLFRCMTRTLLAQGSTAVALWVLRENATARRFYEHLGGLAVGERTEEQPGATLSERAYGWRDLSALAD